MIFEQILTGGKRRNVAYIIGDADTGEAVTVDVGHRKKVKPQRMYDRLRERGLTVKYNFATHCHIDHLGDAVELRKETGAPLAARSGISGIDMSLDHGDTFAIGGVAIEVISTPGHTGDSVCYLINREKLLTGDTLHVGRVPKIDSTRGGDFDLFYRVLHNRLLKLDDQIEVWPGHDVADRHYSTIGRERKTNLVLQMSYQEFRTRKWDAGRQKWIVPRKEYEDDLFF